MIVKHCLSETNTMQTRSKPGPKKRHSGMWKQGQSGNPAGRPPRSERYRSFEQGCREAVLELLPGMVDAVQDASVPVRERTQLFDLLASHGFGRPIDRLAVQSLNANAEAPQELPRELLERRVSALLSRSDRDGEEFDTAAGVDTEVVSNQ